MLSSVHVALKLNFILWQSNSILARFRLVYMFFLGWFCHKISRDGQDPQMELIETKGGTSWATVPLILIMKIVANLFHYC